MNGALFAERYRIEAMLGSGSMGRVYRAWDTVREQDVALKVLREDTLQVEDLIPRFRREVRAASRVDSPHAARILDFGYGDEDQPAPVYLVTELVDGPSLARVLAEQGPLPVPRVLTILGQVADALAAAHACNVVHRDLKPANVLLAPHRGGERVKLVDFGLAKIVDPDGTSLVTPWGHTFGTVEYISPEQATDMELDHRADIYSLGVVGYEMLAGHPPFEGTVVQVVTGHAMHDPPPLEREDPDLGPVEALVFRCLIKDPDKRPGEAREVARAVEEIAQR